MTDDILVMREGAVGRLSLNRPRALNSLTQDMCEAMSATLMEWRDDPAIQLVFIDHAEGTRGFCAGGDVVGVRQSVLEDGGEKGRAFFFAEYRLNHLLFTYPKPIITFMDGVTMGGGVGLSMPANFRVATENTLFAMPEGAIGLFPDIGAGWYLNQLPGQIGKFLALTGARLDGAECYWASIATHYLACESLADAKQAIIEQPDNMIAVLEALEVETPEPRLAGNMDLIERLFAPDTLEEILSALAADPGKWAAKEYAAVSSKCPTSAKVALRQMADAPDMFVQEMDLEYRIAAHMIMRPDFAEGVRAVLVDKDNAPEWEPAAPEDVTKDMLDAIFASLTSGEPWTPLV